MDVYRDMNINEYVIWSALNTQEIMNPIAADSIDHRWACGWFDIVNVREQL